MDIERLIPFLIIYFIWNIISSSRKRKTTAQNAGKPQFSVMEQLIKILREQFNQETMSPNNTARHIPQTQKREILQKKTPSRKKIPKQVPSKKESPALAEKFSAKPVELSKKQKSEQLYFRKSRLNQRTRKQLRQAIVWKEVLDKPLALRHNQ
jgi:hypothetical protein